jgi:hypothetical protein
MSGVNFCAALKLPLMFNAPLQASNESVEVRKSRTLHAVQLVVATILKLELFW